MTESEIWKDVVGYEGIYKVSNKGNVFSVERKDSMGRECGGIILKPKYHRDGYLGINLYKNGKMKSKFIHRLVAEAFLPNQNNYLEINHKDENKTNNYVENLEWCTRKYNVNYGTAIERATQTQSKKVKAINVKTGEVITFNSTHEAGRKGYTQGGVAAASRGDYYGGNLYRGHRWYYEEGEEKCL